jgi:hypothetical protein
MQIDASSCSLYWDVAIQSDNWCLVIALSCGLLTREFRHLGIIIMRRPFVTCTKPMCDWLDK